MHVCVQFPRRRLLSGATATAAVSLHQPLTLSLLSFFSLSLSLSVCVWVCVRESVCVCVGVCVCSLCCSLLLPPPPPPFYYFFFRWWCRVDAHGHVYAAKRHDSCVNAFVYGVGGWSRWLPRVALSVPSSPTTSNCWAVVIVGWTEAGQEAGRGGGGGGEQKQSASIVWGIEADDHVCVSIHTRAYRCIWINMPTCIDTHFHAILGDTFVYIFRCYCSCRVCGEAWRAERKTARLGVSAGGLSPAHERLEREGRRESPMPKRNGGVMSEACGAVNMSLLVRGQCSSPQ